MLILLMVQAHIFWLGSKAPKMLTYLLLWIFNPTCFLNKKVAAQLITMTIALNNDSIHNLDLSPASKVIEPLLQDEAIATHEQQLRFEVNYELEPGDPRELSEIPEVRLWFVRLDAKYPWLPFLLDWKAGELARYAAMLVPHQFSSKEGIQYNPEALEIFLMHKIFILSVWLKQQGMPSQSRLKSLAQMLGYELDDAFFEMIEEANG